MEPKFVILPWIEVQALMDELDFYKHCFPLISDYGESLYGDYAYFVEIDWLNSIKNNTNNTN